MAAKRHRLAKRRKAVGFTQETLAEHLAVDSTTVRRWERGEASPQPWIRPKLARSLQVSVDQLEELLSEPGTDDLSGDSRKISSEARRADLVASGNYDGTSGTPPDVGLGSCCGSCLTGTQSGRRRTRALSKVVAVPSRVDKQSIDDIETIFQDCKRQEDKFGPLAVLHTVIGQREFVDSLLHECSEELRPRLLSVYSSMSSSIGYYYFDLDDQTSAMHYCDQAREAAQEARNTELAIYALCNMSYFASWQGKVHVGIDFSAAAQSMLGKTDDVLLRVCAAERAASAYAIDGQDKPDRRSPLRANFSSVTAWSRSSSMHRNHPVYNRYPLIIRAAGSAAGRFNPARLRPVTAGVQNV